MKRIKRVEKLLLLSVIATMSVSALLGQDQPDGAASGTSGGQGGETVTVSSLSELQSYASSSSSYIILVSGTISSSSFAEVDVSSNKTIIGLGSSAALSNIELHIIEQQNIIIRNLTIKDSYVEGDWDGKTNDNDGIQADYTTGLWIDHCHFTHCGDGLIDLRHETDDVTVSWCHFSNHNKTFGIGWTEETDWEVTIHHCYFDGTAQRNPAFDMGKGHLYNNYIRSCTSYGNNPRGDARVIIQNSRFENTPDPINIDDNALCYSSGNSFSGCSGNQSGNTSSMPWSPGYSYSLDAVGDVASIVSSGVGPKSSISDQYTGNSSDYSTITNRNSGKCIDVYSASTSDGANIVQWTCGSSDNQLWSLEDAGDGYLYIKALHSGKCMRALDGNLVQYTCNSGWWSEMFSREDAGSGYYLIKNRNTGTCLWVDGSSTSSGASIVLASCNSSYWSQQFSFSGTKSAQMYTDEVIKEIDGLSVYPNPVSNRLNINLPENYRENVSVAIYNSIGAMIFIEHNITAVDHQVNVSELNAGMYIVTVSNGKENITQKFSKQ